MVVSVAVASVVSSAAVSYSKTTLNFTVLQFYCICTSLLFIGKLKPKVPEDDEQADLFQGSDSETPNEAPAGGYSSYQNDTPVTAQPAAAAPEGASEKPVIAMPPPPSYGDQ